MVHHTEQIPKNYTSVTPCLTIRGASEAIEYYKKAFGAQVIARFDRPDGKVMHAEIKVGDSIIMLNDECPPHEGHRQKCVLSPVELKGSTGSLYLYVDDVDATFKQALKAKGESVMDVADMFWGDRVGMIRDPFGHFWMIATHNREVSPEEMKRAAEEFFTQQVGRP